MRIFSSGTCNDDTVSIKRSSAANARMISHVTQYACFNDDDDDDHDHDDDEDDNT